MHRTRSNEPARVSKITNIINFENIIVGPGQEKNVSQF